MSLLALVAAPARPAMATQHTLSSKAAIGGPVLRQARRSAPSVAHVATRVLASVEAASTAKIIVQGRNLTVTDALKDYTVQKVSKAVHNFEGAVKEVDVRLSVRGKNSKSAEAHHTREQIVEVTVFTLRHGVVRVEDEEEDIYAAVDLVTDKLKRKLSKLKEKAVQKQTWPGRGGSKGGASLQDALPEEVEDHLPTDRVASLPADIVREKLLILGAGMSVEEAVEQLENVGHDFFVFADLDGVVKVLYRRKSHGYGIIVPQKQ